MGLLDLLSDLSKPPGFNAFDSGLKKLDENIDQISQDLVRNPKLDLSKQLLDSHIKKRTEMIKARDMYIQLDERYKYNSNIRNKVRKDWLDFANAFDDTQHEWMFYGVIDFDSEFGKDQVRRSDEFEIRRKEIAKRFKELLREDKNNS